MRVPISRMRLPKALYAMAAGMAATFGSPVSAVLLAIELLLFEFRPRSFLPVAFAATVAAGARFALKMQYPGLKRSKG